MKKIVTVILFLMPIVIYGQSERKLIREGYRSYMDGEFNEAEIDFRKAEEVNKESFTAKYNTSTALYQQKKIEESAERFEDLLAETSDIDAQAKLHYNLGNSYLESNKLKESIESYKKSLRLNPKDEDTRYNLAYALEKLQEQQQDQNDQQNKDENNDDQKQKQDKNSEDQKQQQDKNDQKDKEKQEQNSEQNDEKEEEQKQSAPQQLSKEDAERLLNAILQKEKDVKEKVDKKKAVASKVKNEKDW